MKVLTIYGEIAVQYVYMRMSEKALVMYKHDYNSCIVRFKPTYSYSE